MARTPVYIKPEVMRQAALSAIDEAHNLPDNVLIKFDSPEIGPDGKFTYVTSARSSLDGLMIRGVYKYTNVGKYGTNSQFRDYSNTTQFIGAILGYSLTWLRSYSLVDADANIILPHERYVLCPDTLHRIFRLNTKQFHSYSDMKTLLLNVPVVLLEAGEWTDVKGIYSWCFRWMNAHESHTDVIYNECVKCAIEIALNKLHADMNIYRQT